MFMLASVHVDATWDSVPVIFFFFGKGSCNFKGGCTKYCRST